eukprot:gene11773-41032_t
MRLLAPAAALDRPPRRRSQQKGEIGGLQQGARALPMLPAYDDA